MSSSGSLQTRFSVGTYNIRRGKGLDGVRDLSRIFAVLDQHPSEIIGLNEVRDLWFSSAENQVQALAFPLGMTWMFAPVRERWLQHDMGNGMLSRVNSISWRVLPLRSVDEADNYRNMVVARFPVGSDGTVLTVIKTHIERSDANLPQIREVLQHSAIYPDPVVVMGDFNRASGDPRAVGIVREHGLTDALDALSVGDSARIEWILSRGLMPLSATSFPAGPSDHPFFSVEFQLEDPGG